MAYIRKDGLIYSEDLLNVVGVDEASGEFTGTIPYGAETIDDGVFSACPYEEITIPDSVKELGACLFENSEALKEVKLPSSHSTLAPYLFSGCTSLKKVHMPNVVTAFPEGLFKGCVSMLDIPFRAGIQEIPESCIEGCTSIKSIVIPSSVTTIGKRAFADCTSLETVVLPAKLYELADDAFEGCDKIRNIRVDGENHLFYVNEDDGCLYEKSIEGEDKLRLKVNLPEPSKVDLFEEEKNLSTNELESFFTDEQNDDTDENCIIEASDEEESLIQEQVAECTAAETEESSQTEAVESEENQNIEESDLQKETVMEESNNHIDDLFADIMGEEKERNQIDASSVAVSQQETQVLSEVMDVMSDAPKGPAVTDDELANLFANHEEKTIEEQQPEETDPNALDSKTQILIDSVGFSKVIINPEGNPEKEEAELFVIAENTVTDENGNEAFSEKLTNCARKIGRIHEFRKIIMLSKLPLDNEEFTQFYHHFINKKNVLLACSAAVASQLSDYSKKICDESRISLDKEELNEQRKFISIKSDMLIKLVIRDI
ncbi:MAG: leucine-rich repeat protein [Treponema sp.]|nr:leucine-rich repeat protein [Treponema sp.]